MIAFVKLSILAFYWRIFNIPSIKLPIKIVAVAVVCWLFARVSGLSAMPFNV